MKKKVYKIDPTAHWLYIKLIGVTWQLEIYEVTQGCKVLRGFYDMDLESHKNIADLIEMPWEYYKMCMDQKYYPKLLKVNVDYWLNNRGVQRCIDSVIIDKTRVQFILKEKI